MITKNKKRIVFGDYEDQLRNMFKEIQIPFMNNCPEHRKKLFVLFVCSSQILSIIRIRSFT